MHKTYDIAIVGGGITGLTLALALARDKFNVALIEQNSSIEHTLKQAEFRVSAINLAVQALFTALDVWPKMRLRVSPFEHIRVFEPKKNYELEFDSALVKERHLGFIAEHQLMLQVLTEALSHYPIEMFYQSAVQSLNLGIKTAELTLATGETIASRLVVGADGMHSKLRDLAGINITQRDYHQVALVAEVKVEKSHQHTAWQCFRANGPLAFLPLKDQHSCSIVWSTSKEEAEQLQQLTEKAFELKLERTFEHRLGSVHLQSPRITFPLKMRYAKHFVKSRLALVGDAIHTIHPLAGQGLNLGLLDVACLAEVIKNAHDKGDDIGDYAVLRRYERWRKSHHLAAIFAMEVFKQGFAIDVFPFGWLRERLLNQFNRIDYLKRWCVEFASGLTGDLPKICHKVKR